MLLNHSGVNWEDVQISFDQWPFQQPKMPNRQVPCLELPDGTKLSESFAITRYLGSIHGYYPNDARLAYEVDYLLEGFDTVQSIIYKPYFEKCELEKEQLIDKIFNQVLPKFLGVVEPLCEKGQWLVGNDLTIADFWIGGMYTNFINNINITYAQEKWSTCLDNFPHFKAYGERFTKTMKSHLELRNQYPI